MQGGYPPLSPPLLLGISGPPSDFPTPVVITHGGGVYPVRGHGMLPHSYPRGAMSPLKYTCSVVSPIGRGWFPHTAVLQTIIPPEFFSVEGTGESDGAALVNVSYMMYSRSRCPLFYTLSYCSAP